jgi:hypothetical protein
VLALAAAWADAAEYEVAGVTVPASCAEHDIFSLSDRLRGSVGT